jgi:uncharacterized protein (DUF1778 family)
MEKQKQVSDSQRRASQKYMEQFVEVKVRMTPDRRTVIKQYAESRNESVNGFINRAISEAIERDSEK